MKKTIVKHKGQWCIKDGFPAYDKPEMIVHHWPIGNIRPYIDISSYEGHEVNSRQSYSGVYTLRIAAYQYVDIYLTDLGKTKSIDTITIKIQCPKVRKGIETRWYNGRWEKLLKSGWVSI